MVSKLVPQKAATFRFQTAQSPDIALINIPEYVPSEGDELVDYFPEDVLAAVGGPPKSIDPD